MTIRPIRTRDNLLALAAQKAPTKACWRAIKEGLYPVKVYRHPPGWVVHVDGRQGKEAGTEWIIGLWIVDSQTLRVQYLQDVPASAVEVKGERL